MTDTITINEIQELIDRAFREDRINEGPLKDALYTGELSHTQPISCMLDLILNNKNPTPVERQNAYKAFSQRTGLSTDDFDKEIEAIGNGFTSYVFAVVSFTIILILTVLCLFSVIPLPVYFFCLIISIIILYGFTSAAKVLLRNYAHKNPVSAKVQDKVAYLPQAMFDMAREISCHP